VALSLAGVIAASPAGASSPAVEITTSSLPGVEVGEPISIQLGASGGSSPYQWVPDSLPGGVTITSGGLLGGAATSTGSQTVEVSVVDAANERATVSFSLSVGAAPSITTTSLPSAEVGVPYDAHLTEANGTAPFTWSIAKGGITGGLLLSSSGTLSGRPGTAGSSTLDVQVTDALGSSAQETLTVVVAPPPLPSEGYVTVDAAGRDVALDMAAPSSTERIGGKTVGIATSVAGTGYWTLNSAGRVHAVGKARVYGSVGRRDLKGTAAGIAALPDGDGYYVVSSTGHVYGFGRARSHGSLPARLRNPRVVGIATTADGGGYWVVTGAGRVYAFGDAAALGSVPPRALAGRIVAITTATTDRGFLLVSSTGRVYGFGGAKPLPAVAGRSIGTVVGIAAVPAAAGPGYWLLTRPGGVYAFGAAREIATSPPQPITAAVDPVPSAAIVGGP
jgi:hypothetical protein